MRSRSWIVAAIFIFACSPSPVPVAEQAEAINALPTLPLITWYSPSRRDHFTTADPRWNGSTSHAPDYQFVRTEGYVYSPSYRAPSDSVPLYSWWSPSRADNFLTSDPAWAGRPGDVRSPDYQFVRVEGYLASRPLAGTVTLGSWWCTGWWLFGGSQNDNYATSDPSWSQALGSISNCRAYRTEGFLLPPPEQRLTSGNAFGAGHMTINGHGATGTRPLLLLIAGVPGSTISFAHDQAYYDNLVFGGARPNVVSYFREVSDGLFTWSRAGVYSIAYPHAGATLEQNLADAKTQAANAGFDFSAYDSNRDGQVTSDELGILVIDNGTQWGAATRTTNPACVRPPGSRVDVCSNASAAGEETAFVTVVHELTHLLGAIDLYGPSCLDQNVALMSCTEYPWPDDRQTYHLDIWHKLQLGWVTPRVRSLLDPGDSEMTGAPPVGYGAGFNASSPILLYDPRIGPSEFFLLEYRDPSIASATGYDADVADSGLDIWYVKHDPNTLMPVTLTNASNQAYPASYVYGIPNGTPGLGRFLKPSDGAVPLHWGNGAATGVSVRAGLLDGSGRLGFEWTPTGSALAGRIDGTQNGYGTLGGSIDLYGNFGAAQFDRSVTFSGLYNGEHVDLPVSSWSPFHLVLNVPTSVIPSGGQLVVNADGTRTVTSNSFDFNIDW
jgi:M6 family metalloprotease-like protein